MPAPMAGKATLDNASSSARCIDDQVALRSFDSSFPSPTRGTTAWMTNLQKRFPPSVTMAWPTSGRGA